jgi:hypothetical protein
MTDEKVKSAEEPAFIASLRGIARQAIPTLIEQEFSTLELCGLAVWFEGIDSLKASAKSEAERIAARMPEAYVAALATAVNERVAATERIAELESQLAEVRERDAVNRKARIVCETAARWVQKKRDRAERAGSPTPWILAVEKELADGVQAYEWAAKEAPPAVPAVAETAEKLNDEAASC